MSCKAIIVLLELWAVAPSSWKNPYPSPRLLKFQQGARNCPMRLSEFNVSEKMMGPITRILIALMAHHTPTLKSHKGTSCIYLGLSTDQYLFILSI
jgi:hypothetical protein